MTATNGCAVVPTRMLLSREVVEVISYHCGDGDDGQFGAYQDGILWIGALEVDDGESVYGLHLATAEYPEEGSSTLVEFPAADPSPAQGLCAELRELSRLIADDSYAISFQSLSQYRQALLAEVVRLFAGSKALGEGGDNG